MPEPGDADEVESFPPVSSPDARCLILGSMPGVVSLRAARYYAHPRNAFWPIMGELLGFPPEQPYAARLQALQSAGIALWDVIAGCRRRGSLDADIVGSSVRPNDFAGFFARHRAIRRVCFNGGAAYQAFRRHVQPQLDLAGIELCRLPSTSPAHAGLSRADKLAAWSVILDQPKTTGSV